MAEPRQRPWIIYLLIAANVAMFAYELARGASLIAPSTQLLTDLGGNLRPRTLGGEWWRLGSSMFLHFGLLHLALNMLCLYQARLVERLFGHFAFLVIYLVAGLGGGVACMLVGNNLSVAVGASGAVFGVYGALGAFLVLRRADIQVDDWQRTTRSLVKFLALNLAVGLSVRGISVSAHVGGVVVGFAVGAALLAGAGAAQQRTLRSIALALVGVALTAVAVMTLPVGTDPTAVLRRFEDAEHAAVTAWNDAIAAHKRGEIDLAELANRFERDAIVPYRRAHDELLATTPDERLRPLFGALAEYTSARLDAWSTVVAADRETDPARREPLLEKRQRLDAVEKLRRDAYLAELHKLR
jgi:rhomboid protease GluP